VGLTFGWKCGLCVRREKVKGSTQGKRGNKRKGITLKKREGWRRGDTLGTKRRSRDWGESYKKKDRTVVLRST